MKYRKRPTVIDAYEYKGNNLEALDWTKNIGYDIEKCFLYIIRNELYIHTLEGAMCVSEGDFIVKGVEGELYPCKPVIFHKTYELVED